MLWGDVGEQETWRAFQTYGNWRDATAAVRFVRKESQGKVTTSAANPDSPWKVVTGCPGQLAGKVLGYRPEFSYIAQHCIRPAVESSPELRPLPAGSAGNASAAVTSNRKPKKKGETGSSRAQELTDGTGL